jgi:NRPS condensation-like uncharacterized protein
MRTEQNRLLKVTPFEEYMLVDDQPAYPMSCFFMIKLRGRFSVSVFESALQQTLKNHPLLTSSATESNGRFYWQNTGKIPEVHRLPLDENRSFPVAQGIDLFREPSLKVTLCNANTHPAEVDLDGQTNIIFEVHHSASDAAGIARFIEDILCHYAQQKGFVDVQREAVGPELLIRRGKFAANWQTLPRQLWGLTRAWMFLMNRVSPLTPKPPLDNRQPATDYPAILCKDLSVTETQNMVQKAKQLGITINDLFLCETFLAMKKWQEQNQMSVKSNLRIAVPTNLRTSADDRMPAANIVSMVFLDRKPKNIQGVPPFYQGVHREMQHIKRCDLGWAFIFGLTVCRRILGSLRKMTGQNRCWTTATVTNLGRLFGDVPLPRREGCVQIDNSLELIGVETSPPVRSSTALGIGVMTYDDCMTINLHYDSNVLTRSDAQSILDNVSTPYVMAMENVQYQ